MIKIIKQIPNTLTLANIGIGCVAIVFTFYDQLIFSSYLIFVIAIIDFIDGFIARYLKAETSLGKQLDSLADFLNFGFLPGLIMFKLLAYAYQAELNAFTIQDYHFLSRIFC